MSITYIQLTCCEDPSVVVTLNTLANVTLYSTMSPLPSSGYVYRADGNGTGVCFEVTYGPSAVPPPTTALYQFKPSIVFLNYQSGGCNSSNCFGTSCVGAVSLIVSQTPTRTPTKTPTPTPSTTPITCGWGETGRSFYYYDCCGNFITGNNPGQVVMLDYTKPSNGILKLATAASTSCPSQTPTPTPESSQTPTPTLTQTPTPTLTPSVSPFVTPSPTNTIFYKLANECDPITLFPLGVECYGTDPTSLESYDGSLFLRISGGTPPYNITWLNGQKTPYLFNLGPGIYPVTVTDFYGDFTATTECQMIAPTPTPTPSLTPTITPTASASYPNLCIYVSYSNGTTQTIQFTFAGTYNGRPQWFNSTNGYYLRWEGTVLNWVVNGYDVFGGTLSSTSTQTVPTNSWVLLGSEVPGTITVLEGTCGTVSFLSLNMTSTPAQCSENCTGTVVAVPVGGTAPYQYSINGGVTFVNNNVFTNLCPGSYAVTVLDDNGNSYTGQVQVASQGNSVQYSVGVDQTSFFSGTGSRTETWKVNVSPALPVGVTLSFNLAVNIDQSIQRPGDGDINYTLQAKKNTTILTATPTTTTQVVPRPFCSPNTQTDTEISLTYPVTMTSTDVISGTSISTMELLLPQSVNGCSTVLQQGIVVSVNNVSVTGCNCCSGINNQGTSILAHTLGVNNSGNQGV